jgi:zinc protease
MRTVTMSGLCLSMALSACQTAPKSVPSAVESAQAGPTLKPVAEVEGLKEYRMENGLRVVLFPDASKPRVTVNITYFVGSRHEGYGEAGMAHLLEHMLFKGTPTRPDIWKSLQQKGANFNGTTWYDRTNYFETLPASRENLEFALALEADRMINSSIAAEVLAKEFSVVRNEFEIDENDPGSVLVEKMFSAAYMWHGYGRSTIGNRSDIEQVPVERLREFYRRYYQPDNAMLVVAGSFKETEALELIEKHFGALPKAERKLLPTYTVEPVQEGERRVTLRRNGDQAVVGVLYHAVAGSHPDYPSVAALSSALTNEPSGLLYRELVKKGLAVEVDSAAFALAEPGTMFFTAKVAKGKDPEEVASRLVSLLENLKPEQIQTTDVKRFQANFARSFDLMMTDSSAVGVQLSEWGAMGDWRLMFVNRDRVESLELKDVQSALKFIKPANRTVGVFVPTKNLDKAPESSKVDVAALVTNYKGRQELAAGEAFEASYVNIQERTQYAQLSNGLKLALMPKKSRGAPVTFRLELPLGNETTLQDRLLAVHMLPRMLMRGTKQRDFEQLRDDLALLKTAMTANAGWNIDDPSEISFNVTTIKDKLPAVVDLLGEILATPRFDAKQFQLVKDEWIANLKEQLQDPQSLAQREFLRTVANYPKGDVRHIPSLAEELAMVEKLQLSEVRYVYNKLLGGSYGRLVMVGDFEPAAIKTQLEQRLGSWQSPVPYRPITFQSQAPRALQTNFDTPDKKGAQVAMGQTMALKETDASFPAIRIAGFIWGQGASSRLINRLRQQDGLSYGAGGGFRADAKQDLGYLSAFAICAPENVEKATLAIREELNRFYKEGVSTSELADAQRAYAEQRRNALARDNFVIDLLAKNLELGRELSFEANIDAAIAKLSPAEVNAAIQASVKPEQLFTIQALDTKAGNVAKKL